MERYALTVDEPKTYPERKKQSIIVNVIVTLLITFFISTISSWEYGLLIGLFFFCIQLFKSSRWDNNFITYLEIDDFNVKIQFKSRHQVHNLEGNLKDFSFKKKVAFNKTKTVYLAVYYKKELKIRQFEIGDWTEGKFEEVVNESKRD